jgi:hypothetical protein
MKRIRTTGLTALNQRGMALVSALLMLLVLSLMAIALSMDSSMNVRIAGYERLKARSYGFAEAGLLASTDLLEDNIYEAGWDDTVPFQYPNLSDDYSGELDILGNGVFYMDENPGTCGEGDPVMRMTEEIQADVVVQRLIAKTATGGALQVAAGYSGIGKSQAAGGTHILYNIRSIGTEINGTVTELAMHYRVVTK